MEEERRKLPAAEIKMKTFKVPKEKPEKFDIDWNNFLAEEREKGKHIYCRHFSTVITDQHLVYTVSYFIIQKQDSGEFQSKLNNVITK